MRAEALSALFIVTSHPLFHNKGSIFDEQINEFLPSPWTNFRAVQCLSSFLYKIIRKEPGTAMQLQQIPFSLCNRYLFFMSGILLLVPSLFQLSTSKERAKIGGNVER